jgi:hypothetical protein
MAFLFKLVLADGTPAEPPTLDTAAPNWRHRRHDLAGAKDAPCGRGQKGRGTGRGSRARRRRPWLKGPLATLQNVS